jgi:calreticulin
VQARKVRKVAMKSVVVALCLFSSVEAKIYFQEKFDEGWNARWVEPTTWKPASEMGKWEHTAGKWYGDESDKGIQTSQDAKHYGLSALLAEPFSNAGKDLVIQYTVKHEQKIDCGGAYIKLLAKADQDGFGGGTPYQIMFGPDICGGTRKTHVIFSYGGKNLEMKKTVSPLADQKSHLYTLVVRTDGTYEVFIDEQSKSAGSLEGGWDFLEPKEIKDPDQSKPADWVDAVKIADPSVVKPEGYDDIPAKIPDPAATKPADWSDEDDGEWEPPSIANPAYKGAWKAPMIDNPDYKGAWVHPMIPNPAYKADATLPTRCVDCGMVGFELWQVKAGSLFDDIIVTDSLDEAKAFAQETFFKKKDAESAMFDKAEEERKAAAKAEADAKAAAKKAADEAKKAEEEAKKAAETATEAAEAATPTAEVKAAEVKATEVKDEL